MFGEKALELIKELKRVHGAAITVYNEDGVRQVLDEMRILYEQNQADVAAAIAGDQLLYPAIQIRHAALERNKRCILTYLYNRLQTVKQMRWDFGSVLPSDIKYSLSEQEAQCSQQLLQVYMYTQQPQVFSQQPQVFSQQPQLFSQQPQLFSQQPQLSTQQPQLSTQRPQLFSQRPPLYTQPQLSFQQPQLFSQQPYSELLAIQQPQLCPQQPQLCNQQPQLFTQQPQLCPQQPKLSIQQPQLSAQQPQLFSQQLMNNDLAFQRYQVLVQQQQQQQHIYNSLALDLSTRVNHQSDLGSRIEQEPVIDLTIDYKHLQDTLNSEILNASNNEGSLNFCVFSASANEANSTLLQASATAASVLNTSASEVALGLVHTSAAGSAKGAASGLSNTSVKEAASEVSHISGPVFSTKSYYSVQSGLRIRKCRGRPKSGNPYVRNQAKKQKKKNLWYNCKDCDEQFVVRAEMFEHRAVAHGVELIKCEVCGMVFEDKSTLRKHTLTHTKEKNYKCQLCRMKFSQSGNWRRHEKEQHGQSISG